MMSLCVPGNGHYGYATITSCQLLHLLAQTLLKLVGRAAANTSAPQTNCPWDRLAPGDHVHNQWLTVLQQYSKILRPNRPRTRNDDRRRCLIVRAQNVVWWQIGICILVRVIAYPGEPHPCPAYGRPVPNIPGSGHCAALGS